MYNPDILLTVNFTQTHPTFPVILRKAFFPHKLAFFPSQRPLLFTVEFHKTTCSVFQESPTNWTSSAHFFPPAWWRLNVWSGSVPENLAAPPPSSGSRNRSWLPVETRGLLHKRFTQTFQCLLLHINSFQSVECNHVRKCVNSSKGNVWSEKPEVFWLHSSWDHDRMHADTRSKSLIETRAVVREEHEAFTWRNHQRRNRGKEGGGDKQRENKLATEEQFHCSGWDGGMEGWRGSKWSLHTSVWDSFLRFPKRVTVPDKRDGEINPFDWACSVAPDRMLL